MTAGAFYVTPGETERVVPGLPFQPSQGCQTSTSPATPPGHYPWVFNEGVLHAVLVLPLGLGLRARVWFLRTQKEKEKTKRVCKIG